MSDSTPHEAHSIGSVAWTALNPFGEPTAYLLVHPTPGNSAAPFFDVAAALDLKRLDGDGDILWIGTDTMYAALPALHVELCTPSGVWVKHAVPDEWTGNAIGRRYIVLVIGTEPLAEDPDSEAIAQYLTRRESVHTGLVKIRLRMEQ